MNFECCVVNDMLLEEIAEQLGCTYSNASWLLRHNQLHGVKENGHWVVTEEDISKYLHREKKKQGHPKHIVHAGDTFGFWTVVKTDRYNKSGERAALCRCVCGKEKLVSIITLIRGLSKSCGCKRHLGQTQEQKDGLIKGREVMEKVRVAKAGAGLPHALNKNSTTGHKGVSYQKKLGTYRAYITINRKQIYLGSFSTIEEAVKARKAAEEKYFAPCRKIVDKIKSGKV